MTANIIFSNAKVYNFAKADVLLGQEFAIEIDGDIPGDESESSWFANNDSVLSVNSANPKLVQVKATNIGDCKMLLMSVGNTVQMELNIHIFSNDAATLNLSAEAPVYK
jgi:hypothetical protein